MRLLFSLLLSMFFIESFAQTLKDCATCSTEIIKIEQIKNLTIDDIRFLTNDLFARKGYQFDNSNIDLYYSQKKWYKPVSNNATIIFNDIETKNIKFFQDRTTELKNDREKLISELKIFKENILKNKKDVLKTKYKFENEDKNSEEYFNELINKISINDINWYKDLGFYKVKIDDLKTTTGYEISINANIIYFKYDFDSGSEEIKEVIYPEEYFSEYTYLWKFEWKNNQLKFIELIVVG